MSKGYDELPAYRITEQGKEVIRNKKGVSRKPYNLENSF
jgi:hypothetical protein